MRLWIKSLGLGLGLPLVAGPITFNTAMPVASGQLIFRQGLMLMRADDDPEPMNRDLRALMAPTVLIYGLDPHWTLMGALPTVDLRLDSAMGRREVKGIGDLSLFLRHTDLQIDQPGETLRLATLVGLKLPTGARHKGDGSGPLPPSMQSGTGSWDPMAGLVFTWQTLRWEWDVSGTYQRRNAAEGFKAGDEGRLEGSFQKTIWHGHGQDGVPFFFNAVLETNAVWRGANRRNGAVDPDSGGTSIYLSPGLQWVSRLAILETAWQYPVHQQLRGQGLRGDKTLYLSVRFQF